MIKETINLGSDNRIDIPSITFRYEVEGKRRDITNIFGFYAEMAPTIINEFNRFETDYTEKEIHIYLSNDFNIERDSYALIDLFYYFQSSFERIEKDSTKIRIMIPQSLTKKLYKPLLKKVKKYINDSFLKNRNNKKITKSIYNDILKAIIIFKDNIIVHVEKDTEDTCIDIRFIVYFPFADGTDVYQVKKRADYEKDKFETIFSYVLLGSKPFRLQDKEIYNQNTFIDCYRLSDLDILYAIESFLSDYNSLGQDSNSFFENNVIINTIVPDYVFDNCKTKKRQFKNNLFNEKLLLGDKDYYIEVWKKYKNTFKDGNIIDWEDNSIPYDKKCVNATSAFERFVNSLDLGIYIRAYIDPFKNDFIEDAPTNITIEIYHDSVNDYDTYPLAEIKTSINLKDISTIILVITEFLLRFVGCYNTPSSFIPSLKTTK